ncbi:MAG: 30S ribosomal protein S8 [Candidatus Omnitrophota bacterium]
MSRTDIIADSFTIIRNAVIAKKYDAVIPYSNVIFKICEILKNEGYLDNYKDVEGATHKQIKVYLRYDGKKNVISQLKRVSRPGRRAYVSQHNVPRVLRGYGTAFISTNKGILTDSQAREAGVGGEVIGMVW